MKNFHLPVPEDTYDQLREQSQKAKVPATTLERQAIDLWLRQQWRKATHGAIAGYATEMAGTKLDLDPDLEAAGVEKLIETGLD